MIKVKLKFDWDTKSESWLVVLLYGVSTLFGSFNAELSHFDKSSNNSV